MNVRIRPLRFALWDTRRRGVAKDFAGGFGVGQYRGRGVAGRLIGHFFARDRRPVALQYAYLAAILRRLGHTVEYCLDGSPVEADVVVFNPALMTLDLERQAIHELVHRRPAVKILVTGSVARAVGQAFADLPVVVVDGEAEQLLWKLDEVLEAGPGIVRVGQVDDLDRFPFPDWTPFGPHRFRVGFDFSRFPTAYIEQSRGCTLACDYCPYIAFSRGVRYRDPDRVAAEMAQASEQHGFRSFKFRDPLFAADRDRALRLAENIARLPVRPQFSIETRSDLVDRELLERLASAGLTSITFGVETPDRAKLREHKRRPVADERQRAFILECRRLGVRTVAGFMIGFEDDTVRSIRDVAHYARWLNPTFANFNVLTPYPGTREAVSPAAGESQQFDVYTPTLAYRHLQRGDVARLRDKCFASYYFRWSYLRDHARALVPIVDHACRALGSSKSPRVATRELHPA